MFPKANSLAENQAEEQPIAQDDTKLLYRTMSNLELQAPHNSDNSARVSRYPTKEEMRQYLSQNKSARVAELEAELSASRLEMMQRRQRRDQQRVLSNENRPLTQVRASLGCANSATSSEFPSDEEMTKHFSQSLLDSIAKFKAIISTERARIEQIGLSREQRPTTSNDNRTLTQLLASRISVNADESPELPSREELAKYLPQEAVDRIAAMKDERIATATAREQQAGLTREQRRTMLRETRRQVEERHAALLKDNTDSQQRTEIAELNAKIRDQVLTIRTLTEMFADKRTKTAVMRLVNSEIEGTELRRSLRAIKEETKNTSSLEEALKENEYLKKVNEEFVELSAKYHVAHQNALREVARLKECMETIKQKLLKMIESKKKLQEYGAAISESDFGLRMEKLSALEYRDLLDKAYMEAVKDHHRSDSP